MDSDNCQCAQQTTNVDRELPMWTVNKQHQAQASASQQSGREIQKGCTLKKPTLCWVGLGGFLECANQGRKASAVAWHNVHIPGDGGFAG
jgi:hypothetical protein